MGMESVIVGPPIAEQGGGSIESETKTSRTAQWSGPACVGVFLRIARDAASGYSGRYNSRPHALQNVGLPSISSFCEFLVMLWPQPVQTPSSDSARPSAPFWRITR